MCPHRYELIKSYNWTIICIRRNRLYIYWCKFYISPFSIAADISFRFPIVGKIIVFTIESVILFRHIQIRNHFLEIIIIVILSVKSIHIFAFKQISISFKQIVVRLYIYRSSAPIGKVFFGFFFAYIFQLMLWTILLQLVFVQGVQFLECHWFCPSRMGYWNCDRKNVSSEWYCSTQQSCYYSFTFHGIPPVDHIKISLLRLLSHIAPLLLMLSYIIAHRRQYVNT